MSYIAQNDVIPEHGLIHRYERLLFKYIYQNKNHNKKLTPNHLHMSFMYTHTKNLEWSSGVYELNAKFWLSNDYGYFLEHLEKLFSNAKEIIYRGIKFFPTEGSNYRKLLFVQSNRCYRWKKKPKKPNVTSPILLQNKHIKPDFH